MELHHTYVPTRSKCGGGKHCRDLRPWLVTAPTDTPTTENTIIDTDFPWQTMTADFLSDSIWSPECKTVRQVPFRKPLLQGDRFRQWSFVKNTTRVTEVSSFLTVVSSVKKPATVEIQDGLRIANGEQEFHTRFQNQTQLVLPSELWRLLPQLCTYVFRPHFFFIFFLITSLVFTDIIVCFCLHSLSFNYLNLNALDKTH